MNLTDKDTGQKTTDEDVGSVLSPTIIVRRLDAGCGVYQITSGSIWEYSGYQTNLFQLMI